jgi:hypothetical protein
MPSQTRHIKDHEIAALPRGFTSTLDIKAVEFIDRAHNPLAKDKIVCRGPKLYWQSCPKDFTREPLLIQSLLMHELCHVWQYETGRLSALVYLLFPSNWFYAYKVKSNASFDSYPIEKQADLLQDWFLVNSGAKPLRYDPHGPVPTLAWLNSVVPFNWEAR